MKKFKTAVRTDYGLFAKKRKPEDIKEMVDGLFEEYMLQPETKIGASPVE